MSKNKREKEIKNELKENFIQDLIDYFRGVRPPADTARVAKCARVKDCSTIAVDLANDDYEDGLLLIKVSSPKGQTSQTFDWESEIELYEKASEDQLEAEVAQVTSCIERALNRKDKREGN